MHKTRPPTGAYRATCKKTLNCITLVTTPAHCPAAATARIYDA